MIVTRKHHVPWTWIVLAQIPFATWMFTMQLNGTAFTFSFKKFIDNPGLLSFVLTAGTIPGIIISPVINYMSDRIWGRFGRRKIFVIWSSVISGAMLFLMPLAPDFFTLTALLWAYQIVGSFGPTFQPLSQEIIPPSQRGMGSAIHSFMFYVGILLYYSIMIGRFDDVYYMGPVASWFRMTGEQMMYWICAPLVAFTGFVVALGIKEILPPSRQTLLDETGRRIGMGTFIAQFVKDVFELRWMVLYTLIFSTAIYSIGLGALSPLLYTEQWGYSNQDFGTNVAVGAAIMLPITFMTGWVCDKFSKMRVYQTTIVMALIINVLYVLFVWYVLPDHRPALWQIILFGEITAIIGTIGGTVTWPLMFEYVPRNKMGTTSAGMGLMFTVFGIITQNIAGWWVTGYSDLLCPRPGSRVQVVLTQTLDEKELRHRLAASPQFGAAAAALNLEPFFYPGLGGTESRQWVIRDHDCAAEKEQAERKRLDQERTDLQAAIEKARKVGKTVDTLKVGRLDMVKRALNATDSELAERAQILRVKIEAALGRGLVAEGGQIQAASWEQAAVVDIPSKGRIVPSQLVAFDRALRAVSPAVVEVLHVQNLVGDGGVSAEGPQGVAVVLASGNDTALSLGGLTHAITAVAQQPTAGIKKRRDRESAEDAAALATKLDLAAAHATRREPLLHLELTSVEPAHAAQAIEIGAGLRMTGTRGVRIDSLAGGTGIDVRAVFHTSFDTSAAPAVAVPVVNRFCAATPAGADSIARLSAAATLYDEVLKAGASRSLTVARPIVSVTTAPQKYNYFSGYLLTILGGIIALLITFLVVSFERKGYISKLGLQEDAAAPDAREEKATA